MSEESLRIEPTKAKQMVEEQDALLICAYKGDKYRDNYIDGSISYGQFREIESDVDKDDKVVFYCA